MGSCPDRHVHDPFAGACRAIACPPGLSFNANGRCQQDITKLTDNPDCSWIRLGSSEYQLLFNKSIYVPVHEATYDTDSYHLDDNDTVYVCTSFLRNYTEWVDEALRVDAVGAYMSTVCSAVSLLALSFQFTVYMLFPVLRNTPGRCIICLVVSLFVGQLLFVLVKTGRSVSSWFCFVQAATMHYAFMAAFFWMSVIAFDVQRTFGASPGATAALSSPSAARRRFVGYSVYAWLSALAVVGVCVAMDVSEVGGAYRPHYGHHICWFGSRGGLLVLFGVPVGVLLTANIVMFVLSIQYIRSASEASKMAVQKTDQTPLLVIYVKLSLVMGLGWLLGFVAAFTDWPALWYSFIVVNSLQGAMLCIAFVATRQVSRLIADCMTSLRRRVTSGTDVTSTFNEPSQSIKLQTSRGVGTEVVCLSPEINHTVSSVSLH